MSTINSALGMVNTSSARDMITVNRLAEEIKDELTLNELTRRELMRRVAGTSLRDYDAECGYLKTTEIDSHRLYQLFKRDPIAKRIVEIWPKECWKLKPKLYDTEEESNVSAFEFSFQEMCKGLSSKSWATSDTALQRFWSYLEQADILTGVGYFGIILLGINDGKDLSEPIDGLNDESLDPVEEVFVTNVGNKSKKPKHKLLYMQPYSQYSVDIVSYEQRKNSKRYGLPTMYHIKPNDGETKAAEIFSPEGTLTVHWSRVVHLVDSPYESEVYSDPRILATWNRLHDLTKLYGGSAEMYWLGALPGIKFEPRDNDVKITPQSVSDIKGAVEDYLNGLKRFLASDTMTINTLSPTVVAPNSQIEVQIDAICIALGTPKRIFLGSERGELSSSQDQVAFDDRIEARRTSQINPRLIIPVIDHLILMGVLPVPIEGGYSIAWESIKRKSDSEKAGIASQITTALGAYIKNGLQELITPLDYLVKIHGFPVEEAEQILKNSNLAKSKAASEVESEEEKGDASESIDEEKGVPNDQEKKNTDTSEKEKASSKKAETDGSGTTKKTAPKGKEPITNILLKREPDQLSKTDRLILNVGLLEDSMDVDKLTKEERNMLVSSLNEFGWSELTPFSSSGKLVLNTQGTSVKKKLDKPFRTPNGPKKFGVYVKNETGSIVLVRFGDPNMEIKRDSGSNRNSFRARHGCDTDPGPKWKPKYWSCRMWEKSKSVSEIVG